MKTQTTARDTWEKIVAEGTAPAPERIAKLSNAAYVLYTNILGFLAFYGKDYCAMATFTLSRHGGWRAAQSRFRKMMRHIPSDIVRAYICVLDYSGDGRAHLHVIFAFDQNVASGFRMDMYQLGKKFEDQLQGSSRWREQFRRHEHPNEFLRAFRQVFKTQKSKAGFGRIFELEPVVGPAFGIAVYLSKAVSRHGQCRTSDKKGARFVRYSAGCHRTIPPGAKFCRNTPQTRAFWTAVDEIVAAEGLRSREEMKFRFGKRWLFHLRPWIREIARQIMSPTWLIPRRRIPGEYFCRFPNSPGCQRWVAHRITGIAFAA